MTEITPEEIVTGQPVKTTTMQKVRDGLIEHEARTSALEGGGATVYPPIILRVNGSYGEPGDFSVDLHGEGVLKTTLNFNIVVTGVRLIIDEAGVSGTTEIDLKYKRGAAAYTSIFTTKPSVAHTAGDDATSSNGVVNLAQATLEAGDILRLDITSVQARAKNLMVRIDYYKE